MKKIVLIMLLTFTTIAFADEGSVSVVKYTMVADQEKGVWILDSVWSQVKHCWYESDKENEIICSAWLPVPR